jgi:N-glycosylase/DNA lyase
MGECHLVCSLYSPSFCISWSIRFICSSNNNIPRITKMVQGLCNHFSPPLVSLPHPIYPDKSLPYHPFPSPSVLSHPSTSATLRSLRFGYRADFIQKTAKILVDEHGSDISSDDPTEHSEKWLKSLRSTSTTEARYELLKLTGVGRKVADCVLLMSLDKARNLSDDHGFYLHTCLNSAERSHSCGYTCA